MSKDWMREYEDRTAEQVPAKRGRTQADKEVVQKFRIALWVNVSSRNMYSGRI